MKVAVLGSKGMLGTDLVSACRAAKFTTRGFDLPRFDITRENVVHELLPQADWVVNCAGYTRVDDAETHKAEAYAVNAEGAHRLARICEVRRIKLMYISTDYVFDGRRKRPYTERDDTEPLNVYGASKLAGEKAVQEQGGHFLVVRTESLFGRRGPNFVRTIVRRLRETDEPLRVVNDQVCSPTYTRHLAGALVRLLKLGKEGIVHVTASGQCSWFEFAQAIAARVRPEAVIEPISAADLDRPAARPVNSLLDNSLYITWTGHAMPSWEQGLDEYLAEEKWT